MKASGKPGREHVLRAIARRFPLEERNAALEAVDVYVHEDEAVRARTQLTILDRSDTVASARDLARHLLIESAQVQPPRDTQTVKNEHYAG